ncbi:MAG: hypothetical protein RIB78_11600 [Gammaproteobacteria bacterium]
MQLLQNKTLFLSMVCAPLLALSILSPVMAETDMDRCYKSDIDYADNPNLTQAERLAAMNAALFDSINRFEECMLSTNASANSSNSANGGAGATGVDAGSITGSEGNEDETGAGSGTSSIATSELSGTETIPVDAAEVAEALEQMGDEQLNEELTDGEAVSMNPPPGTGKAPEDIPSAANDDAVAAQIRLAAEVETDPEKKAKLWNEYRKYKGLPVKEDE